MHACTHAHFLYYSNLVNTCTLTNVCCIFLHCIHRVCQSSVGNPNSTTRYCHAKVCHKYHFPNQGQWVKESCTKPGATAGSDRANSSMQQTGNDRKAGLCEKADPVIVTLPSSSDAHHIVAASLQDPALSFASLGASPVEPLLLQLLQRLSSRHTFETTTLQQGQERDRYLRTPPPSFLGSSLPSLPSSHPAPL